MKRLDLVRRLEEEGCVLLRHGSRHDIYHNPLTGHSEPLPRHREIEDKNGREAKKGNGFSNPLSHGPGSPRPYTEATPTRFKYPV
jgi:hypothetical protein